ALTLQPQSDLGDLLGATLPPDFTSNLRGEHRIMVVDAGELAPASPLPNDPSALDDTALLDIFLYVEYKLKPVT
ncbi:MAG: hypothetical protein AB1Z98_00260, partial [Nannocystaceae bacterium]